MKNHQIEKNNNIVGAGSQHGSRRRKAKRHSVAKTVRVRLWADKQFVALIDRGAKECGTSRSGFIRQAIEDVLPRIEAATR